MIAESAIRFTPLDIRHFKSLPLFSVATFASVTSAPALQSTSTMVTVSISSLPEATGTSTVFVPIFLIDYEIRFLPLMLNAFENMMFKVI